MHASNQKGILLIFALAGLLGALELFLFYEQFRLRIDIDTPLRIAVILLWFLSVVLIARGLGSATHALLTARTLE